MDSGVDPGVDTDKCLLRHVTYNQCAAGFDRNLAVAHGRFHEPSRTGLAEIGRILFREQGRLETPLPPRHNMEAQKSPGPQNALPNGVT